MNGEADSTSSRPPVPAGRPSARLEQDRHTARVHERHAVEVDAGDGRPRAEEPLELPAEPDGREDVDLALDDERRDVSGDRRPERELGWGGSRTPGGRYRTAAAA